MDYQSSTIWNVSKPKITKKFIKNRYDMSVKEKRKAKEYDKIK